MSLASDFVTIFRDRIGSLMQVREGLRAMQRVLTAAPELLEDKTAFDGTNNDLSKELILAASTSLDILDKAISTEVEKILFIVGGTKILTLSR